MTDGCAASARAIGVPPARAGRDASRMSFAARTRGDARHAARRSAAAAAARTAGREAEPFFAPTGSRKAEPAGARSAHAGLATDRESRECSQRYHRRAPASSGSAVGNRHERSTSSISASVELSWCSGSSR